MNREFLNTYKVPLLLLAANLLLALMLFAEWRLHDAYRDRLGAALQVKHSTNALFGSLPEYKSSLGDESTYHAIVDQPIFIEGRLPVEKSDVQTGMSPVNPEQQGVKPTLRLTGVALLPQSLMALIQDNLGKNFRVKQGGSVQGWNIDSVLDDKVIITSGTERQELLLREFKPAKKPPPGAPSAPHFPGTPGESLAPHFPGVPGEPQVQPEEAPTPEMLEGEGLPEEAVEPEAVEEEYTDTESVDQ